MAKSKSGGTRAYIRGRIGSDVYSVGKDGKGSRQQVVRSLAEQVSNPRTEAQMFGRMLMSTVMQAVSGLAPIIDHSFDGVAKGQPSISEFIRLNYALVKADATAHPASGNSFSLAKYQEKGAQVGPYVISNGSVAVPVCVTPNSLGFTIDLTNGTFTVGGLKEALGLSADGYFTFVFIGGTKGIMYCRVQLSTTLADSTELTAGNIPGLFSFEGNLQMEAVKDQTLNKIYVQNADLSDVDSGYALIVSEKMDGAWKHSSAKFTCDWGNYPIPADTALPTYPTGSQQFLNGGQL